MLKHSLLLCLNPLSKSLLQSSYQISCDRAASFIVVFVRISFQRNLNIEIWCRSCTFLSDVVLGRFSHIILLKPFENNAI